MVRIPGFHCRGPGSIPGRGTEILHAACRGQKNVVGQEEWRLMAIAKGRRWEKPGALETLATGSNIDSKTSYLNLKRKSLFFTYTVRILE